MTKENNAKQTTTNLVSSSWTQYFNGGRRVIGDLCFYMNNFVQIWTYHSA